MRISEFETVFLGVFQPQYFPGFGVADRSDYADCAVGAGITEKEALDDMLENLAQQGVEFDEQDILDDFGFYDDVPADEEEELLFYVAIMYNNRDEKRMAQIRDLGTPLRYSSYARDADGWDYSYVADGDISYGDLEYIGWDYEGALYILVPHCDGADYAGCTVTLANYRAFLRDFRYDFVHKVYGGHGTYAIALCVEGLLACDKDTFEEVVDVFRGLADYPVVDEDTLFQIEMEQADEAWNMWAQDDFVHAIEARFNVEIDALGGTFRALFEECAERANCHWESEGMGPNVHIDVDEVASCVTWDDIKRFVV